MNGLRLSDPALVGSLVAALTAPVWGAAPVISGSTACGSTLTVTDTSGLSGNPTPTKTYQWYRNSGSILIGGETSISYVTQDADVAGAAFVTCDVTGTNSEGFAGSTSNGITMVNSLATNTVAPVISGSGVVLSDLTLDNNGTWTFIGDQSVPPTYTRQWQKDSIDIGGETGVTYTPQAGDIGSDIRCGVIATTASGAVTAYSNAITVVA